MQVDFSISQAYTPTWRGNVNLPEDQRIRCRLVVLDMNALMSLLDAFSSFGIDGVVDTDHIEADKIKPIIEQFGHLLPKHVEEFSGLFDAAGAAINIDQVARYPRFLNLAVELLMQLTVISSPSDDDVGNLSEPPVSDQDRPEPGSQDN